MAISQTKSVKTPNGKHEESATGTEHVRSATAHLRQVGRSASEALQHANKAVSDSIREDFSQEIQPELGAAADDARKAGAAVMPSVNAETDLLVVGESSRWGAGDAGGRKILAASAKREGGRRIDWITGEWFLKLVGAS